MKRSWYEKEQKVCTHNWPRLDCRSVCQEGRDPGAWSKHMWVTHVYCKVHLHWGTPSRRDLAEECCGNGRFSRSEKRYQASKLWSNPSWWDSEFYLEHIANTHLNILILYLCFPEQNSTKTNNMKNRSFWEIIWHQFLYDAWFLFLKIRFDLERSLWHETFLF